MTMSQEISKTVRQVEIKAYLDNYQAMSKQLLALSGQPPLDRVQNDTFFHCRSGRLKLRSSGTFHDLIYYRRQNDYGPTESFYQSAATLHPGALRTSLVSAFGEAGRVKKFRRSFRISHSRIGVGGHGFGSSGISSDGVSSDGVSSDGVSSDGVSSNAVGGNGCSGHNGISAQGSTQYSSTTTFTGSGVGGPGLGSPDFYGATLAVSGVGSSHYSESNCGQAGLCNDGLGESVVHLDKVVGLGHFIEIKTELTPTRFAQSAASIVESLMEKLNIDLFQLVDGAYIDLINERSGVVNGNCLAK